LSQPNSALVHSEYDVSFNGVEGIEYTFTEPSTVEGELREVRVLFEGKSFLLRFAYSDDKYKEDIDQIISSLSLYE
jgi:hypothetical protein